MARADEWGLRPGDRIRRSVLHDRYGGSRQSGISPSRTSPNVLLFSGDAGLEYGYHFDGWSDDGTYHYTGEGQRGDQRMTRGNFAILHHMEDGRALRLFEKHGTDVVYIGEFAVPNDGHVLLDEALDVDGILRSVIVFRLRPIGDAWRERARTAPTGESYEVHDAPVEAANVEAYVRQHVHTAKTAALRSEALLVQRYVEWARRRGHTCTRNVIVTAAGARMYTDVFVVEAEELIEAKAASSRSHVREALGQVLDYARYVAHRRLTVLTPTRPSEEMIALLIAHGVGSTWEAESGEFVSRRPEPDPWVRYGGVRSVE